MNMFNIKPCPFCGGTEIEKGISLNCERGKEKVRYYIFCKTCEAQGGVGDTEEDAIAVWNWRIGCPECMDELKKWIGE